MTLKQQIHNRCLNIINEKVDVIRKALEELRESAANETKSTAGDKHETALAMLQIEQENKSRQLNDLLSQKVVLDQLNLSSTPTIVSHGSVVTTNKGVLFFSVGLGKLAVDERQVIALSIESPLGQKLKGLSVGKNTEMNGCSYTIEAIE